MEWFGFIIAVLIGTAFCSFVCAKLVDIYDRQLLILERIEETKESLLGCNNAAIEALCNTSYKDKLELEKLKRDLEYFKKTRGKKK